MNKKISEDDIKQYINDRLPEMSLPNIYFSLKKQINAQINEQKFNSIESNFTPIFLYFAIEQNCSVSDFSKILQISQNYEEGLNRFFYNADCDYVESKNSHIYDKMSYVFYKQDDENIIFDEEKIPYIKEIIKNVRLQNLLQFHSSRIDSFLAHIINKDLKVGKEIIETVASSAFMWIEEQRQFPNMIQSLINIFANENYSKDISNIYNLFKENNHIYNEIKKNIIPLSVDKNEKYKINLSIYKMVTDNENNYFDLVENRLRQLKEKLPQKDYIELVYDSIYSFETGVQNKPVMLNLEKIKPSNKIVDNIPYIVILQKLIHAGQYAFITGKNDIIKDYIINQKLQAEKNYQEKIINFTEYMMIEKIENETIEKFLNFQHFNNKYKQKDNKNIKNKI